MRVAIMVFIGLPGCGKTELAKKLLRDHQTYEGENYHFIHVCFDDLISLEEQKRSRESETKWKEVRKGIIFKIQDLISSVINNDVEKAPVEFKNQIRNITDSPIILIIDDNMYYRSMRYTLYQMAREYEISFCQVFINCSLEDALRNNSNRPNVVPPYIVEEMSKKIESPKADKWEKFSVVIDIFSKMKILCIFDILKQALSNPECKKSDDATEKEESAYECSVNILHQTDIALRQIVSDKIKQFIMEKKHKHDFPMQLKQYTEDLRLKKAEFLQHVQIGKIVLPVEINETDAVNKSRLKSYIEEVFS